MCIRDRPYSMDAPDDTTDKKTRLSVSSNNCSLTPQRFVHVDVSADSRGVRMREQVLWLCAVCFTVTVVRRGHTASPVHTLATPSHRPTQVGSCSQWTRGVAFLKKQWSNIYHPSLLLNRVSHWTLVFWTPQHYANRGEELHFFPVSSDTVHACSVCLRRARLEPRMRAATNPPPKQFSSVSHR